MFAGYDASLPFLLSQDAAGIDGTLLEQELRNDPHITAVLIASANSATQHLGKPVQTLPSALAVLGAVQSASNVSGLAKKRVSVLTNDGLLVKASELWTLSQRTADYGRTLARMLEVGADRCFCAGLLQSLGDLAVLGCLQEWLQAGGALNDEQTKQSLEQYSAAFGSALRTRWRLPLELRELIAAVYQYNKGVYTREVLVMNLAGQMARHDNNDSVTTLFKTMPARLLKMTIADLQRLRKKLTGITDSSLLAPAAALVAGAMLGSENEIGPKASIENEAETEAENTEASVQK